MRKTGDKMKKIGNKIKQNAKAIAAFLLGIALTGGTVYAATVLPSSQVGYDNSASGLAATDVQGALDELNTKANTWLNPNDMGTPQYYATTGKYKGWCTTTDTTCNSLADFPTTSTTPPSGKNVYAVKYEDEQYGVCIKRNGKEHCFRGRNYKAEEKHVQEVFSDISCVVESYGMVHCDASDFSCAVDSYGPVFCSDRGASKNCVVNTDGSVDCN